MTTEDRSTAVRSFWDSRAWRGREAGTQDVILKELEVEAIAAHVRDGMRILDAGCGNGVTAIELARRYDVEVDAIDFSPEMIAAARRAADGVDLRGRIHFSVADIRGADVLPSARDLVYSERLLINLPDWPTQEAAIRRLSALLAHGGAYLMCEHSQNGLDEMNRWRELVGLRKIDPPWHNRYLRDAELDGLSIAGLSLERVLHFSSTYYLLSRIVNAYLAAEAGQEPDYMSPVNQLALRLPPIGAFGQGRIWLWRRTD